MSKATTPDEQIKELEIRSLFQEQTIDALKESLNAQDKLLRALADDVSALKEAMRRVSQPAPDPEILGKYDVDDPVPRAG